MSPHPCRVAVNARIAYVSRVWSDYKGWSFECIKVLNELSPRLRLENRFAIEAVTLFLGLLLSLFFCERTGSHRCVILPVNPQFAFLLDCQ